MSEIISMPEAIAEAIGTVMAKVKHVEKRGTNEFHRYKFARVEDLMFQVQPALSETGLVITQDEVHCEVMSEALMMATYAFTLSHKSGVSWGPIRQTGMASIRNSKGGFDDKALNKCHTAARKYFVLGLFQVPAGDLPDADNEEDKPQTTETRPAPSNGQERGIKRLTSARAKELGKDAEFRKLVEGCTSRDMTESLKANFERLTAEFPLSWLDAMQNEILLREEEIVAAEQHEELDSGYRETMRA